MQVSTQSVVQQVLETIPAVMRALASELRHAGHDMAPAHFRLLFILREHPCNLSELAERQMVSLPTMSNSITTLVERGWARRTRSAHDRRVVLVELTSAGQAVLADIRRHVEARVTELLGPLSPDDCQRLSAGLDVLRSTLAQIEYDSPCSG
jgi:DNA-binding MarR family transcriptional regulator